MATTKLSEGLELVPLAILCNIMIYVAVEIIRRSATNWRSAHVVVGVIFATTVFVVCGFEHCIANAFYFGVAGVFSLGMIKFLIVNAFFNAIGGIMAHRLIFKEDKHGVHYNEN